MTILQGIILGLIQGLTEFLPVSSTGHLIIAHEFLQSHIATADLYVDATLHLATLLAVMLYFWKDLWGLVQTVWKYITRKPLEDRERAFLWAVVLGTIPGVVMGLVFEDKISTSARSTFVVAWGLIMGSIMMWFAERHHTSEGKTITARLGWRLGWFQALALFPGISRSGSVISGGLFSGLSRSDATRFAFVLSFPILLGAGGMAALDLADKPFIGSMATPLAAAFAAALVSGLLSIHYLLKFVRTRSLKPFIWYRLALAALLLLFPF